MPISSSGKGSDFWRTLQTNVKLQHQALPIKPLGLDNLSLSLNQKRLCLLEQLQPSHSVYNLLHIFHFNGWLNVSVLEASLSEIVRRHNVLRTIFTVRSGEPSPTIKTRSTVSLPLVDLQHLPLEQREAVAQRSALDHAAQPFDLEQGPLWRFQLLQLAPNKYILARTVHHLIFDGWSHSVFLRELAVLYTAFLADKPSPLPELTIQYSDYAAAQQQWLAEARWASQLNYWQQQLQGSVSALELPNHYSRPMVSTYRGECQGISLSRALTKALKTLSHQQGVSVFATLLSAFKVWLYYYTGQTDMLVCSPVANRHHPETKGLIGYFNNVVVIRTDISGDPSFCEVMGRVSQVTIAAYANQDVSLQQIAEFPNLARVSLTRAMFVLQNTPSQTLELEGLAISSQYVERPIANFDLTLSMQEHMGQLTGKLQFKTDLFDPDCVAQMLALFQSLLETLATDPHRRLSDVLQRFGPPPTRLGDCPDSSTCMPKAFVAPRDDLEIQLTRIWEQVLNLHPIGVSDNLFGLGGDSLLAVRLVEKIEQAFCKNLPLITIFQAPTIAELADRLRQQEGGKSWSSLMPIQPQGHLTPLFLCEGVGIYYPLLPHLAADQPVYGLVAGSFKRQPIVYTDLSNLAAHYLAEIKTLQPTGPYYLGGISWGGVIAYEMAQQLVAQGEQIGLLAFFDTIRPGAAQPLPLINRIRRYLKRRWQAGPTDWWQTGQQVFRRDLLGGLRNLRSPTGQIPLAPHHVDHQAMRQAFIQACEAYKPEVYPGEIIQFVATDRVAAGDYLVEPELGWKTLVSGGITTYFVPGDHLDILQEPHVKVLGETLQECLERARANSLSP